MATITFDCQELQRSIDDILSHVQEHLDVNRVIIEMRTLLFSSIEELIVAVIENLFDDSCFLGTVKALAAKCGLRFKGFKPTSIRLLSGRSWPIRSPYFAKAKPKSRRGRKPKKRKPKTGCHLALAYVGLIDRCSAVLASTAVQASLLCPSFEIAHRNLSCFGIEMDTKTIRRLAMHMGEKAMEHRHQIALSPEDHVDGRVLFVCIDGGRLRERRNKSGRIPKELKRRGYHSNWREPIQIVIQWLDAEGNPCHGSVPLYDAMIGRIEGAFDLLENYLRQIDVAHGGAISVFELRLKINMKFQSGPEPALSFWCRYHPGKV